MDSSTTSAGEQLAVLVRQRCIAKGWDLGELARVARVSRTTLLNILRGRTTTPRLATLSRIAAALGIAAHEMSPRAAAPGETNGNSAPDERQRQFDSLTNAAVAEALDSAPVLSGRWNQEQWDELYSTFGVGGALTPDGARLAAEAINRKDAVVRKLQVILETHLADVAETLVDSLYGMVAVVPAAVPAREPAGGRSSR